MATSVQAVPTMPTVAVPATTEVREKIAVAAGFALLVAGILLVTAVLPAEYGLDPLGTGEALGLTAIAPVEAEPTAALPTDFEPVRPGANTPYPAAFKRDTVSFKLGPLQGLEYKYQLPQGGTMVYSWRSTGLVKFDFHGEPEGAPRGYAESYEMGEKESAAGAFYAPTAGIHGWYWENTTKNEITVTLTSAGFYTSGIEFTPTGTVTHRVNE
jgi:hypothetical protein